MSIIQATKFDDVKIWLESDICLYMVVFLLRPQGSELGLFVHNAIELWKQNESKQTLFMKHLCYVFTVIEGIIIIKEIMSKLTIQSTK